jgi:KDO2-lipid IV(A) lauroyltransferase
VGSLRDVLASAETRIGALLGWFAGSVLRIRRAHVESAMERAGIARSLARAMYRSLGASLVELLWLAARPALPASHLADIEEGSRAILDRIHARGRGMVLATAHAGNWEIAAAAIAERYPLTVVAKPMHVGWVDRFCRRIRTARGIAVASPRGAMGTARAALGRGEVVAMLIDQVPDRARHALAVEFLGATAHVDRAPAVLAAAARAPLVLGVARREGSRQVLEVLAVLEPPAHPGRAWVDEATRAATVTLDRFVRANPSEWLWLHRRWRPAPP